MFPAARLRGTDGAVIVNVTPLDVPAGVVTTTCPLVAVPGTDVVICESETSVKVADVPLKVTAVAPVKP